jgi:hypothetical protein
MVTTSYDRTPLHKTMYLGISWQFWMKMWQTQPKSCVTDQAVVTVCQTD